VGRRKDSRDHCSLRRENTRNGSGTRALGKNSGGEKPKEYWKQLSRLLYAICETEEKEGTVKGSGWDKRGIQIRGEGAAGGGKERLFKKAGRVLGECLMRKERQGQRTQGRKGFENFEIREGRRQLSGGKANG